jgi:hypothetical protein
MTVALPSITKSDGKFLISLNGDSALNSLLLYPPGNTAPVPPNNNSAKAAPHSGRAFSSNSTPNPRTVSESWSAVGPPGLP